MNSAIVMFVMLLCERCDISKYLIYVYLDIYLYNVKLYFPVVLFVRTCTITSHCSGK